MIHLIFHVYFAEVGNFKQLICLIVRRSEKDYFSMFNAGLKNEDLKLILLTTSEKLKYFCSILDRRNLCSGVGASFTKLLPIYSLRCHHWIMTSLDVGLRADLL